MIDEVCEVCVKCVKFVPVSQNRPQFSTQTGLHQHVQVFTVLKRAVQPEHKQKLKHKLRATPLMNNHSIQRALDVLHAVHHAAMSSRHHVIYMLFMVFETR